MPKPATEIDGGAAKPIASAPAATTSNPEANKLWIHCNRCCEQYVQKKSTLFLLACHHVTCDKCVKVCAGRTPSDAPVYECPVCHSKVRGRQINNAMPNTFKQFFHPEAYSLNNEFVTTFQMANHRHFDRFKEKKQTTLHKLTKDIELAKSICQKRYSNLEVSRVERRKLTQRMRQIKLQVAKRSEEKEMEKRMAADRHHRTQEPKSGQVGHRAGTVSPTSSSHSQYRNAKNTSSSSSQKRKQVTSFQHQPNYSFNL